MDKTFKKLLEHCVKHHFVAPSGDRFALLGNLLRRNITDEWYTQNVSSVGGTVLTCDREGGFPLTLDLLGDYREARSLLGSDEDIVLAGETLTQSEPTPQSCLSLHHFTLPARKMDSFSSVQKRRRLWWKSFSHQPELLAVSSSSDLSPGLEQKIEITSPALPDSPLETISLWKPEIFDNLEVNEANSPLSRRQIPTSSSLNRWTSRSKGASC